MKSMLKLLAFPAVLVLLCAVLSPAVAASPGYSDLSSLSYDTAPDTAPDIGSADIDLVPAHDMQTKFIDSGTAAPVPAASYRRGRAASAHDPGKRNARTKLRFASFHSLPGSKVPIYD